MTFKQTMAQLKKMGTAQNVKIYKRHGAAEPLFGVSFANLNVLKNQIKVDQGLAEALWESGNMDARTLATMVADPESLTASRLDVWARELDYHLLADLLAGLTAKTKHAARKAAKWTKAKGEYVRQCGYALLASMLRDGVEVADNDLRGYLKKIESEIHASPNRARHAMNGAMIAIGVYRPDLTDEVLKTAARVGKVEVDHGQTSCKTPDATDYIKKALARPQRRRHRC